MLKSIFALLIIIINSQEVSNQPNWVDRLTRYIQTDLRNFQAILIVDDSADTHDTRITDIARKIQKTVSTQVMQLKSTGKNLGWFLQQKLDATTLLIITEDFQQNPKYTGTTKTNDFLIRLLGKRIRPKCLMIALPNKDEPMYRKLLQYMWANYFLDFTILEVRERQNKRSFYQNVHQQVTTLHYFNPFKKVYTKKDYKTDINLFPNKLEDLYGFEMKVGSFHSPPYVFVKRNLSNYLVNISGEDAQVIKALSRKMNFSITEVSSQKLGRWDCNNENKTTGIANLIAHNQIQFMTNREIQYPYCERVFITSKSTTSVDICALVRIINQDYSTSSATKWIYLILMILTIWIFTYLLKFKDDVWSWFEILRAMLGFTVPREPPRLLERIAFISFLMAILVFSSNIFAMLTDVRMTKKPEMKFNTLGELNRSFLTPTMLETNAIVLEQTNNNLNKVLVKKSNFVSDDEQCVDMILQEKNVSCILRELKAQMAIEKHRNTDGSPLMQIVKQRILSARKVIYFEPKSPYIRKVDAVLGRLMESGLINHWEMKFLPTSRKSSQREAEEELQTVSVLDPIVFLLAGGCTLSIAVFICELFTKYIQKHIDVCVF